MTPLAPYAVPLGGTLGRVVTEAPDATRNPFQRDRDRVIHTQAFRRLQGKTQVFVAGETIRGPNGPSGPERGDHYRTRLTHTMEVAQIARDIARTLGLNEDLTETIALSHDLGHPPFGHAGEEALDTWMKKHGSSFEHNDQSLRVVTILEEHANNFLGLNLNREVLEGLAKHRTPHDQPSSATADLRSAGRSLSLEGQVVNLADEIAYSAHDCDDGIYAKLFSLTDLSNLSIVQNALEKISDRGTSLRGGLIELLTHDLYETTRENLKNIQTLEDVYQSDIVVVNFSADMQQSLKDLRSFLWDHMYLHASVQKANDDGKEVILKLAEKLLTNPTEKVLALQKKTGSTLVEAVKDYVAGMTDRFATAQ